MRRIAAILLSLGLAGPGWAGVDAALDRHILPGFAGFADATAALARTAAADCRPEAVRPALQPAFDAWMAVADLRLGPSETGALSVAFWPDARGLTQRTLGRLIAAEDPIGRDPAAYAEESIAARGLFALEMLVYDPALSAYGQGSYACALVVTVAADLSRQAEALSGAWAGDFARTLRTAGEPGNATFLTADEAFRALYTQVLGGLEFTADQRLGQPMGTFERPRPTRAEAWRSGRSLRNVVLAAEAAHALASALADWDLPKTDAAMNRLRAVAAGVADPGFQDVTNPSARLRAEALQQQMRTLRAAIEAEIGARLGIAPGFNSQDGD